MKTYNNRCWLNGDDSPSTGSLVAFDGMVKDRAGEEFRSTFLQVSDCFTKVKLHKASYDTIDDFIHKMKRMRIVIDEFIEHLERHKEDSHDNPELLEDGK